MGSEMDSEMMGSEMDSKLGFRTKNEYMEYLKKIVSDYASEIRKMNKIHKLKLDIYNNYHKNETQNKDPNHDPNSTILQKYSNSIDCVLK